MVRKGFILITIAAFGFLLFSFIFNFDEQERLPAASAHYMTEGPEELGAANVVTAVVVTYRGLDTLGEVTILFTAAAVVGLLLKINKNESPVRREGSEILKSAAGILFPMILIFGSVRLYKWTPDPRRRLPGGGDHCVRNGPSGSGFPQQTYRPWCPDGTGIPVRSDLRPPGNPGSAPGGRRVSG